ncbi:MAG: AMP-binding protein [Microthrixaceae bacterium]
MLSGTSLCDLVDRRADATPDALFVVDEHLEMLTFGDLAEEVDRAAAGLRSCGVAADSLVLWQLPNWIVSLVLPAALSRIGAGRLPVTPDVGATGLKANMMRSAPDLVVAPTLLGKDDYELAVYDAASSVGGCDVLLVDRALPQGDPGSLVDLTERPTDPDAPPRPSWRFPTGSSSADLDDERLMTAARTLAERLALTHRDRIAVLDPVAHLGGIVWLAAALTSGASLVLVETVGDDTLETLDREGVTVAPSGDRYDTMWLRGHHASLVPPLRNLRAFVGADVPGPTPARTRLGAAYDVPLLCGYGLVEAPIVAMPSVSDSDEVLATTHGRAAGGVELEVLGPDDAPVAAGTEGRIVVRCLSSTGVVSVHTADRGILDEAGNLIVTEVDADGASTGEVAEHADGFTDLAERGRTDLGTRTDPTRD